MIDFKHRQSAHCETGALSNLLAHYGFDISEALCFGIGSGLFFGYFPFVKVHGLPLITYRNSPGAIFKRVTARLGIIMESYNYRNPEIAMDALDRTIDKGIPVGVRAGMYWLPYFPSHFRFHFNAHNLIVYGRSGSDYRISDPVLDEPVLCSRKDLARARFAQGLLAPKGAMYYLTKVPDRIDLHTGILKGIREVSFTMVTPTAPLVGVWAIRTLAKKIKTWSQDFPQEKVAQYLGHIIRMQEEIGTGGGGFRLIYAAFLQEASEILNKEHLFTLSHKMTATGDQWREFALKGARICKGRGEGQKSFVELSHILSDCAAMEKEVLDGARKALR